MNILIPVMLVAHDDKFVGLIAVADVIRDEAPALVAQVRECLTKTAKTSS